MVILFCGIIGDGLLVAFAARPERVEGFSVGAVHPALVVVFDYGFRVTELLCRLPVAPGMAEVVGDCGMAHNVNGPRFNIGVLSVRGAETSQTLYGVKFPAPIYWHERLALVSLEPGKQRIANRYDSRPPGLGLYGFKPDFFVVQVHCLPVQPCRLEWTQTGKQAHGDVWGKSLWLCC